MKFAVLALALGVAQSFKVGGDAVMEDTGLGQSYTEKTKGAQYEVKVNKFAKGSPGACRVSDTAKITYTGKFADGTVFDSTDKSFFGQPMKFQIGASEVIPCLDNAFLQMHVGESASITCPSSMAYGEEGSGPVPPNTNIFFDVDVINCETTF